LTAKNITEKKFPVMNYQGVPKIMKIGNAKMFFTNKNPILCPIQSCSIIGWKNKTT